MGELDKGLQLLRGRPLVAWVAECIAPQVDEVLLSANRNLECYRELDFAVLPDAMPDFPGPLAGLHRALGVAQHPLWLSVPCDTPFLPGDLVQRMRAALLAGDAELVVAASQGYKQPVICLGYTRLHAGLGAFLASGGRRVGEWQASLRCETVSFDDPKLFENINTPAELAQAEAFLSIRES
jgi:molybdopterin-guanine dinucleotide biosynthesis protein A